MSEEEGKAFGFDKAKTKTHIVSFRLDEKGIEVLNGLFATLNVEPRKDTITEKMVLFVGKVDALVKDHSKLKDELTETKRKLTLATHKLEMFKGRDLNQKPKPTPKLEEKRLEKPVVNVPKEQVSEVREASITPQKPITQPRPTMESIIQKAIDEKRCLRGNDLSNYPEKYRQIACNWCYINKRDYYDRCQATMKQKV